MPWTLAIVALVVASSCTTSDDDDGAASSPASSTTSQPAPATTDGPAPAETTTTEAMAAPVVEEIRFTSGNFELVGDLTVPAGEGPHPAVIVVHGDGPQTRDSTPGTSEVLEQFGAAGFAVLAWDKPGSGQSTGEFDPEHILSQRAAILADGVRQLGEHPAIDADRIGFWGLSQAGWVMPMTLDLTDDAAFMVVVSGGGEDGIEQVSYQLGQRIVCQGGTEAEGELVEQHFPQVAKGPTYDDYLAAMEVLMEIDGWETFAGPELLSEEQWRPWPAEIDAYFDPITVIERTTIPLLAVFGEMDRYVDPLQGAAAYEEALAAAGNGDYRVEVIPEASHIMQHQQTMCGDGTTRSSRYVEVLDEWITTLSASWSDSR